MAHIFSLALCTFFAMQLFIGIILLFDLVMLVLIRRCLYWLSSKDKWSYHVHVRTFFSENDEKFAVLSTVGRPGTEWHVMTAIPNDKCVLGTGD
jgi:hypothetical protein